MTRLSVLPAAPQKPKQPFRVFISYARKDVEHLELFEKHLARLQREGWIDAWSDRRFMAGDRWEELLLSKLRTADLVLLLVTADFMASNYIQKEELPRITARHLRGELCLIPILVRHTDIKGTLLSEVQYLPPDEQDKQRPIATWPDQDEAWVSVVHALREALEQLEQKRTQPLWQRVLRQLRLLVWQRRYVAALAGLGLALLVQREDVLSRSAPFSVEIWALAMPLDGAVLEPVLPGDELPGPSHLTLGVRSNRPMCFALYVPTEDGGLTLVYPPPPAQQQCLETTARFVLPETDCCVVDGTAEQVQAVLIAAPTQAQHVVAAKQLELPGAVDWSELWREPGAEVGSSRTEAAWTGAATKRLREGRVIRFWKARNLETTEAVYYKLDFRVRVSEAR